MKYFKVIANGCVLGVGSTNMEFVNGEITEAEFHELTKMLCQKPEAKDGFIWRLREDLTWESIELPNPADEEELTAEEALAELMEVLA